MIDHFPIPAPVFNGNSRRVEIGNAFAWLQQGWALFVAWPGQWLGLTIVLLVLVFGTSIVPWFGWLASTLLTPLLAGGMLHACRQVADGRRPEIPDLFHGFSHRASELVLLGVANMLGWLLIALLTALVGGGGIAAGFATLPTPASVGFFVGSMMLSVLLPAVLSVPLMMALWFAPALVLFNRMSPLGALRASFDACLKNTLPFLIYGLILMVLVFFATLPALLGYLLLIPVVSGSVYAAYRDIFLAD